MKLIFLKFFKFFFSKTMPNDPKQDLIEAREISEKLYSNIIRATWYSALYDRSVLKGEDIEKAFESGRFSEMWGLDFTCQALTDALIMALARTVFGERNNTASLEKLMEILKRKGVYKLLEEENDERNRILSYSLGQFQQKVNKIKRDRRVKKIKTYRNTQLAHLATQHDPQRHIFPAYEELPEYLKDLRQLVIEFQELLSDPSKTQSDFERQMRAEVEMAENTANQYWEYVAHIRKNLSGSGD